MSNPKENARLVSPSDVAQMSQRSRAAVSNWRANENLKFPQPAGGTSSRPLFNYDEIVAWLAERDIHVKQDSPDMALWSILNTARGRMRVRESVEFAVTVLVAAEIALRNEDVRAQWDAVLMVGPDQSVVQYRKFVSTVDRSHPELAGLLSVPVPPGADEVMTPIAELAGKLGPSERHQTSEELLRRLGATEGRTGGDHGLVGSRVSHLLVDAAKHLNPSSIYDPAMGLGAVLLEAHEMFPKASLAGEDVNDDAMRLARQRAYLADVIIDINHRDVLLSEAGSPRDADVILAEPPFGMSFDRDRMRQLDPRWSHGQPSAQGSELLWLQHVLYNLAEQGRGFVVTTRGTLSRSGADRRVRENLVRSGAVEAVVGLPGKMLPHTSIPLALWVLRRPPQTGRSDVLFIDASQTDAPEHRVGDWLRQIADSQSDASGVPPHVRVPLNDVLAERVNLQPERWTEDTSVDTAVVADQVRGALERLVTAEPPKLDIVWPLSFPSSRVETVEALRASGLAVLQPGTDTSRADDNSRAWTIRRIRAQKTGTVLDAEGGDEDDGFLTEAGDIVFSTMNKVEAVVDHVGGRPVARMLHILRLRTSELDPEFVAACLEGSWNAKFISGTAIQRINPRDLEIPLISEDDQRKVTTLLAEAAAVRQRAREIESATQTFIDGLMTAVRHDIAIEESN